MEYWRWARAYLEDSAEEDALCGEQGEGPVREGEPECGWGEEGDRACAGSVRSDSTGLDDVLDEVEVLVLLVSGGRGGGGRRGRRQGGLRGT